MRERTRKTRKEKAKREKEEGEKEDRYNSTAKGHRDIHFLPL